MARNKVTDDQQNEYQVRHKIKKSFEKVKEQIACRRINAFSKINRRPKKLLDKDKGRMYIVDASWGLGDQIRNRYGFIREWCHLTEVHVVHDRFHVPRHFSSPAFGFDLVFCCCPPVFFIPFIRPSYDPVKCFIDS